MAGQGKGRKVQNYCPLLNTDSANAKYSYNYNTIINTVKKCIKM